MKPVTASGKILNHTKFHAFDKDKNRSLCYVHRLEVDKFKTDIESLFGKGETYEKYKKHCCAECIERFEGTFTRSKYK